MRPAIGYLRVSTEAQGKSGLGLEAQREQIQRFSDEHGFSVTEWFTDVQSGKGNQKTNLRPGLAAALATAKRAKCHLLVSKLDRLSRNATFLGILMEEKVSFLVCELGPEVDRFMLRIYAAVAEKERELIGQRIRDALAAKRARGERLGSPQFPEIRKLAYKRRAELAQDFDRDIFPVVKDLRDQGLSLRKIADHLNRLRVATQYSGQWCAMKVSRMLDRQKMLAICIEPATINQTSQAQ